MTPRQRFKTAVHEAGHAIAALHYGFRLRPRNALVLEPCGGDGLKGIASYEPPLGRNEPFDEAVVGMAGLAAETLFREGDSGKNRNPTLREHKDAVHDKLNAARALKAFSMR